MDQGPFKPEPATLLRETAWLRGLLRSLVRDADAADDLAQETWLRAVRRDPEERDGLRPWLRRTAERLAFRFVRRDSGRRLRDEDAARPEATPATADLVARVDLHRRLVDEVLRLEEPARTTVMLRFFEGLKPGAIAKAQGVPVATVRTRLRRALERLR